MARRLRRRLQRSLRRARLRTWKAVRTYPMLLVTIVILGLAAAGSLGAFQASEPGAKAAPRVRTTALEPTDPYVTPADLPSTRPRLQMTYFLVSTPEMQEALDGAKDELHFREWLEKSAFEVLLIRTPEDEQRAQSLIATARTRPLGSFVIEDLRTVKPGDTPAGPR